MERNEELVDVSMEVFDNVVLNRRILPVNMLSTDNLVRNAVRRYDDAPYIPDNTFVVLRCPLDGKIPGSDYFDTATCPLSNNVRQIPAAEARETSRSVLNPPASTIIFMILILLYMILKYFGLLR